MPIPAKVDEFGLTPTTEYCLLIAKMALQDMTAEWINRYAKKKPPAQAK